LGDGKPTIRNNCSFAFVKLRVVNIELVPAIKSLVTKLTIVDEHLREMLGLNVVLSMRPLSMVLATNCAPKLSSTSETINSANVFVQEFCSLKWDKMLLNT